MILSCIPDINSFFAWVCDIGGCRGRGMGRDVGVNRVRKVKIIMDERKRVLKMKSEEKSG